MENISRKKQENWKQYVELNKFFRAPVKNCRSDPCASMLNRKTSVSTNLSLSWKLACDPGDPDFKQQIFIAKKQPKQDLFHLEHGRLKAGKSSNPNNRLQLSKWSPKRRQSNQLHLPKQQTVQELPKIIVLDATRMFQLGSNQKQPAARRNPKVKSKKIRKRYAVPLCKRPTQILGPQRDNMEVLQRELLEQQLQMTQPVHRPLQHLLQHSDSESVQKYALPRASLYHNLRKGTRYCGNFYYKET